MAIRTWGAWWLTMVLGCLGILIWVWVNTYRYIFSGMNIHLPAILGFTRGTRVLTHCHILNTIHMASEIYQTWGNWWHQEHSSLKFSSEHFWQDSGGGSRIRWKCTESGKGFWWNSIPEKPAKSAPEKPLAKSVPEKPAVTWFCQWWEWASPWCN